MPPLAYAFWQSVLRGWVCWPSPPSAVAVFPLGAGALKTYFLVASWLGLPGALLTFTAPHLPAGAGDAGSGPVAAAHLPDGRRRAPAEVSAGGASWAWRSASPGCW